MTITVVYVHGAGNKPPRVDLKREWDRDLFGADMGVRTRMAYYADLLHATPGVIGADACTQEEALSIFTNEATSALPVFEAAANGESGEPDLAGPLTEQGREFALRLAIDMTVRANSRPATEAWVAEALPLPAALRRRLLRELLRRFIPDADAYFFAGKGDAIRQRVRDAIGDDDGPVVVVGHSLGTVVAYDVLHEPRFAEHNVPALVTLGSPLGYTEIQDVITKPLRVPSPVRMWANFADPFDVVTLDTTLADDFGPASRIIDAVVANPSPNSHASCGYLRASKVRAVVDAASLQPA